MVKIQISENGGKWHDLTSDGNKPMLVEDAKREIEARCWNDLFSRSKIEYRLVKVH